MIKHANHASENGKHSVRVNPILSVSVDEDRIFMTIHELSDGQDFTFDLNSDEGTPFRCLNCNRILFEDVLMKLRGTCTRTCTLHLRKRLKKSGIEIDDINLFVHTYASFLQILSGGDFRNANSDTELGDRYDKTICWDAQDDVHVHGRFGYAHLAYMAVEELRHRVN